MSVGTILTINASMLIWQRIMVKRIKPYYFLTQGCKKIRKIIDFWILFVATTCVVIKYVWWFGWNFQILGNNEIVRVLGKGKIGIILKNGKSNLISDIFYALSLDHNLPILGNFLRRNMIYSLNIALVLLLMIV